MPKDRNANIIEDTDGKKIVVIHDIKFKGKRNINWDEVKEYLKTFVGDFYKIADTGDIVYIGNDFPNEYTGSEYTYKLRGTASKAKANATQEIPELLEIALGNISVKIGRKSITVMPNSAGIDMIPILPFPYMMEREKQKGIMCFMPL